MEERARRAQTARGTINILQAGHYVSPSGRVVSIADLLEAARRDTVLYTPESFDEVFQTRDQIVNGFDQARPTDIQTSTRPTLAVTRALAESGHENVCCLNFASAKNPGGGFLNGAQAQEESLARASGLYPCISQKHAMYNANRRCKSCLYTDHMVYSPKVPVFRDDNDELLEDPFCVSFITAPAVNAGAVRKNEPRQAASIDTTMETRIEKILSLAVIHQHKTIVLGAWGCGVFRNNPTDVANWFHMHLVEKVTFAHAFDKVVFAVYSRDARFHLAFSGRFQHR